MYCILVGLNTSEINLGDSLCLDLGFNVALFMVAVVATGARIVNLVISTKTSGKKMIMSEKKIFTVRISPVHVQMETMIRPNMAKVPF